MTTVETLNRVNNFQLFEAKTDGENITVTCTIPGKPDVVMRQDFPCSMFMKLGRLNPETLVKAMFFEHIARALHARINA